MQTLYRNEGMEGTTWSMIFVPPLLTMVNWIETKI